MFSSGMRVLRPQKYIDAKSLNSTSFEPLQMSLTRDSFVTQWLLVCEEVFQEKHGVLNPGLISCVNS